MGENDFWSPFYRAWQQGKSPIEACRSAIDEVREALPDPYYWAPYVPFGRQG